MKVWIMGSGGREHAIGWAFKECGHDVFFIPGNAGTERTGENIPCGSVEEAIRIVKENENEIDLLIPGSEEYIAKGVADALEEKAFAPKEKPALLESSKIFAKKFMKRYGIRTANFEIALSESELEEKLKRFSPPYVLKADPLAGGKGVIILENLKEAIEKGTSLMKGELIKGVSGGLVLDEYLKGEELSAIAVVGERGFKLLPFARDYKRAYDNDQGPNTGGMGSWAPVKIKEKTLRGIEEIIERTLYGLKKEGLSYRGFLYLGLMLVEEEPYVLEYNVRLGDPETEAILPLDPQGFVEMVLSAWEEGSPSKSMREDSYVVDVVIASEGYPMEPKKGMEIIVEGEGLYFFAGVSRKNDKMIVSGGRVIHSVGVGKTLKEARDKAYEGASKVKFEGAFYRKDIAHVHL
ncbi:MAG: phosphoribosylamine--glycine ligase [Synergistetes bacterium]|nr:phosphoribosylamine--glycine ligase [Synergistota bacterium]MDW8192935.1 phosphoribosylamine--glycine ligase [Synergistota bacterium]